MDSRRQLKIGSLIKEIFSQVLLREGKNLYGKALVTVTNVKVTSDLTLARFYLSIYNTDTPDSVIDVFNEKKFEIKRMLAEKLRHDLRRIPEIEFFRDDTLDYVYHMEDVFKKIKEEDERIAQGEPVAKAIKTKKAPAKRAAKKTK
ncbi:MAG: 30S ribosome-binding factor RbfA [Bacteroidetes bacterium]|nr:30S ribosome-binding factor RbfA [Bacteroidota bacterium]MBK8660027.1 30S ribosome-binding factor RbfA [Bacteroidota bacterium]